MSVTNTQLQITTATKVVHTKIQEFGEFGGALFLL